MAWYSNHIGEIAAISAGIAWGFLGIFVREADSMGISSIALTCLRYLMISFILGAYFLIRRKDAFRFHRKDLGVLLFMSVVGVILNSITYLEAMKMTSLSIASVLQDISPFFVLLLAVPLFHERITRRKGLAVVMAFLGCVLCTRVLTDLDDVNMAGVAIALISGINFSFYSICMKVLVNRGYDVLTLMFYSSMICWIGLMPFGDLPSVIGIMSVDPKAILIIVFMGLAMTLLPFLLYNYALSKTEAGTASICTYAEPLTATVIGLMMFNEAVSIDSIVGIALIMIALVMINRKENASGPPEA